MSGWVRRGLVWGWRLLSFAPRHTRQNRLSPIILHEVTIYMGADGRTYVHHLSLAGTGMAEVAIRMCWEAMQQLAMAAGVGMTLPVQAAVPVELVLPNAVPVPAHADTPAAMNGRP